MIRRFKLGDEKEVSNLISNCLNKNFSKYYSKETMDYFKTWYTKEKIIKYAKDFDFYVIEENNMVIGSGALNKNEIKTFFIDSKFQGKGYGKKLLSFLEKKCKYNIIHLTSFHNSTKFYKKQGYKFIKKENRIENNTKYSIDKLEKTIQ